MPSNFEERDEQNRLLFERLRQEAINREAERERSRLSDIESRKRWDEIYAAMNLDEIIEIPGRRGGEDIIIRATVGADGQLREVRIVSGVQSESKVPFVGRQEDIVRLYVGDGLTLREIGDKLGVSRQTVCNILKDAGITAAQKGKKPEKERLSSRTLRYDECT